MLSEKGCIFAASTATALACLLLPLEARAQCGGARTQMRTVMNTSLQSVSQSGSPQSYAVLSLLQQQQQNAQQVVVPPPRRNAVKPVLKQQNGDPQPDAAQQQELQNLVQASRQQQLAELDALKQKVHGATQPGPAPDR